MRARGLAVPPPPPPRNSAPPPPPPPTFAAPPTIKGPLAPPPAPPPVQATSQPTLITTPEPTGSVSLRGLQAGETVAGYELVHRVKAGGMGSLWVGRRSGVGGFAKHVAIKVIHPHLGENQEFVRMFLDEARLTARIGHPNVIQVTDVGTDHGSYFMVMELVGGCSLADASTVVAQSGRRMQPELAVSIVHQIALGLHAAHELRGTNGEPLHVVHRDVSPDNVLLGLHGAVKLIDFGIAMARERLHQTQQPTLKGKLRYLAPEQLGGVTDRRTDVFALGIVLWELLTGHRLYDGASEPELLDRVRAPRIMAPSGLVPEIGPALDRVIAAMTAVDPDARPATAAHAAAMLFDAFPAARSVGAVQVAQLASATMKGGLGVSDGIESIAPSSDLGPLTADRLAASAYTTGRILLPQPRRPATQGPLFGAAVVTAVVIVLGALIYGYQVANEGAHEIRVQTLPPRAATAPAPQPTLVTTHAPIAPLPAAPVERIEATPPATRLDSASERTVRTERRTGARPPHRQTPHTVVDGTTLAHEL